MRPYITLTLEHGNIVKLDGCGDTDDISKMIEAFLLEALNNNDKLSFAVSKAITRVLKQERI